MIKNIGQIKEIRLDQLKEVATFTWSVYQDATKRTTPPYHSLEAVEKGLKNYIECDTDVLLGYYEGNELLGVMGLIVEADNLYCSARGPYIQNTERYFEIAEVFLTVIDSRCKGHRCFFGTTKPNAISQKFLESRGYECTDDTVQTRVTLSGLKAIQGPYSVEALTEADFEQYKNFHSKYFSSYYWSADRIYEVFEKWDVFIVKIEDEIVGNSFTLAQSNACGEVYGGMVLPQYEKTEMFSQLLFTSTLACFNRGVTEIVNFVPEGYLLEAAENVGYRPYDTYLCYEKQIFLENE